MILWTKQICSHFFARFSRLIFDNLWMRNDMGVPTLLNCCGLHQASTPIQCSGMLMDSLLEVIGLGEIMKEWLSWDKQPQGDKWDVPYPRPDSPRSLSTSSSYFARIQREVFIYNPQLRDHITLILLLLSLYVWSFGSLKLTFPVIGKNIKLFEQSNVDKWSPLT